VNNKRRWGGWRPAVAQALLFMQMNLLVIALAHHHGSLAYLFDHRVEWGQAANPSNAPDPADFCPVCQIVWQGVAQAAQAAQVPRVDSPQLTVPPVPVAIFPSTAKAVVCGRAPPLS
jgi:hypothetical protein